MSASTSTIAAFSVLVLVVFVAVVKALRRARWPIAAITGVAIVYIALPALLAGRGLLDRYNPLPAPALLLVLGVTAVSVAVVLSDLGGRLARATPMGLLVLFQSFRIAVEVLLHRLHVEGVIPVQMTYAGRNWDVLTGVSGVVLGAWLVRGTQPSKPLVLAWNVLGLGLLLNIVAIAVLSTPVPFRYFTDGPANLLPSTVPFVWLPTFLVQVALASHLLVFRQLGAERRLPERQVR